MYLCRFGVKALVVFTVLIFLSAPLMSQSLFSYIDENGIRVLTNVPPKGKVQDLKTTGAPMATPELTSAGTARKGASAFDPVIEKYATQYQLDPSLVRSVIATESGFNPKAVSSKGARGLMQLMPSTASLVGVTDAFDPEQNILGGVKHLRYLLDTFNNDLPLSLAAYNAGAGRVQRVGGIPNIRETQDYVRSVTRRYGKIRMSQQSAAPAAPTMFRFTDTQGVLHLTNIPPVQRAD